MFVGRPAEAVSVLHGLVQRRPDDVTARVDLARSDIDAGLVDDALRQLIIAGDKSVSDATIAELIRRRIGELREWIRWRDTHLRFHQMRIAALRERLGVGLATLDERAALAYLLLFAQRSSGDAELQEAIAVLKAARRSDGCHVRTLELLSHAYNSRETTDEEWHELLRQLEEVAPHSTILQIAGDIGADESADFAADHRDLLQVLVERACNGDVEAAQELRKSYRRNPTDSGRVSGLMFVEAALGDQATALRLADELATHPALSLSSHFNLAQVYWHGGRTDEAYRHLDLADASAADDQERSEVAELRAALLPQEQA